MLGSIKRRLGVEKKASGKEKADIIKMKADLTKLEAELPTSKDVVNLGICEEQRPYLYSCP